MPVRSIFVASTIAVAFLAGAATAASACGLPPNISGIPGPIVDVDPTPTDVVAGPQAKPANPKDENTIAARGLAKEHLGYTAGASEDKAKALPVDPKIEDELAE